MSTLGLVSPVRLRYWKATPASSEIAFTGKYFTPASRPMPQPELFTSPPPKFIELSAYTIEPRPNTATWGATGNVTPTAGPTVKVESLRSKMPPAFSDSLWYESVAPTPMFGAT